MNPNIANLHHIAGKAEKLIIGLMSGTSVDGLDVALCNFSGSGLETRISLLAFKTIPYDDGFKQEIKSVFSKRSVDLEKVCLLNPTIYHAPKLLHPEDQFGNATLQIGDGDHLAVATGIITISDFRQKHIAAGGEGAPLAVFGDYLIFSSDTEDRIMLNIGGIANFTYLPASRNAAEVFSTDVGTGNTMMDVYVQQHFPGLYYDTNATIARKGIINQVLLHELKQHPFFERDFPKTIGPELFNLLYLTNALNRTGLAHLTHTDILATLNRFSADMIADALQRTMRNKPYVVYVSGGGMHNPLLMQHLQEQLTGVVFRDTNELHIHPDAKEAVLFAVLANEAVCGGKVQMGAPENGIPHVSMGKISFPS